MGQGGALRISDEPAVQEGDSREIKPAPKLRIGTLNAGAMVRDEDNPVNVAKKMEGATH